MTSLGTKLNQSLMKAVLIGGLTAAGTFVLSPGTALNPVALGAYHIEAVVPLVAATGLILAGSSVATDFILPMIQKEVSAGNPELLKMENVVLSPIVIGGVSFALLSLLSPESLDPSNDLVKQIFIAGGTTYAAGTVAEKLGWVNTSAVTY